MSDGSTNHRRTQTVNGHDYEVGFYPGFASRITLDGQDLYHQKNENLAPYHLPPGASRPLSTHTVELNCASKGFGLGLHIDDPQHVVESIVVKLRDPDSTARNGGTAATMEVSADASADSGTPEGGVQAYQDSGSTFTVYNAPTICPPTC
jgi:hypothetical protein